MARLVLVLLCCAGAALATPAPKEPAGDDRALVQGDWEAHAITIGGLPIPAEILPKCSVRVEGDTLRAAAGPEAIWRSGEKVTFALGHGFDFRVSLNPAVRPKEIDLRSGEGEGAEVMKGIYRLDGRDRLVIFYTGFRDRPTEFKSELKPGEAVGTILWELRRPKP
jgi:uncharacterized protein (TIGR03067 family)